MKDLKRRFFANLKYLYSDNPYLSDMLDDMYDGLDERKPDPSRKSVTVVELSLIHYMYICHGKEALKEKEWDELLDRNSSDLMIL